MTGLSNGGEFARIDTHTRKDRKGACGYSINRMRHTPVAARHMRDFKSTVKCG
jgi:hypothetical protein